VLTPNLPSCEWDYSLILKTESLDNACIREFSLAYLVNVHVILGHFFFQFSLGFYILGAFLIKQLFHSRLMDIRCLYF